MIKTYYKNGDSATDTYRVLRLDCGLHNHPTICKMVKKFEETEVVTNIERPLYIVSLIPLKISENIGVL